MWTDLDPNAAQATESTASKEVVTEPNDTENGPVDDDEKQMDETNVSTSKPPTLTGDNVEVEVRPSGSIVFHEGSTGKEEANMNQKTEPSDTMENGHVGDSASRMAVEETNVASSPSNSKPTDDVEVEVRPSGSIVFHEGSTSKEEANKSPTKKDITPESDLSRPDRKIWVVTTAGLPWRTGTAVNPLMRALYLTRGRPRHSITLMIPWLTDEASRKKLYGKQNTFTDKKAQEDWIRDFCRTRAKCANEEANLRIWFYDGSYNDAFGSIFPTVDICSFIPKSEADVVILEEPEHLNWFRLPASPESDSNPDGDDVDVIGWSHKFRHSVGILHTNYGAYIRQYAMGTSLVTEPALNALSSLVIRAYCDRVIRLSAALTSLDADKEVTCNVHGVRSEFLDPPQVVSGNANYAPVYFIGKLIWAKGFDKVLILQERFREATGDYFPMDVYGGGNDEKAIQRAFFGRHGQPSSEGSGSEHGTEDSEAECDKRAAEIFGQPTSLRLQITSSEDSHDPVTSGQDGTTVDNETTYLESASAPFSVFGQLGGKALSTGAETADAAMKMVESLMETFTSKEDEPKEFKARTFNFVPPRSTFKWRRTPIPARFLGVRDHIIVRDIPEHKIFLNMSTTEVLCTTTAEALAMGKFVILPKHPSNEFFFQFPNCLAYKDIDDCVTKMQYALSHNPEPLIEKYAHLLSWDGATERLYDAASISTTEAAERREKGMEEDDIKAAKLHISSTRKSHFVSSLFSGKMLLKKKSSTASSAASGS